MRTTGLLRTFINGETINLVDGLGTPTGLGVAPRRSLTEGRWRDKPRRTELVWRDGQPQIVDLIPPNDEEREPVPEALQHGTIDAISALVALLRQAAATGRCEGAAQVFDGRRRTDFTVATEGREVLAAHRSSIFQGEALRCAFEGRQIAGFWREGDREALAQSKKGVAWIASPSPGFPPIPVRIEAESGWGMVHLYLTRLVAGEITLPTQGAAR